MGGKLHNSVWNQLWNNSYNIPVSLKNVVCTKQRFYVRADSNFSNLYESQERLRNNEFKLNCINLFTI